MNQKLYAFWPNSDFPFICGGPITEMKDTGLVETSNFGKGFLFPPCKILPLKAGEKLHQELTHLEIDYRSAKTVFENEWKAKARKLLQEIK